MATVDMLMPQMGESITEGTIIKWHKKEGDKIEKDEILLEISTDKVDSEIPSPETGVIQKILFPEGETVQVGSVIAQIATEGSAAEAVAGSAVTETPEPQLEAVQQEANVTAEVQAMPAPAGTQPVDGQRRRYYSPLVRSIARAESVSEEELARIPGSGARGRVTKTDILAYIKSKSAPAQPVAGMAAAPVTSSGTAFADNGVEVIPMDNMRKSIAEHMVKSVHTSPHVFAVSEADMTELVRFRTANKEQFLQKAGTKLTYMPFIVQATARALVDFPMVNSSVEGTNILRKRNINIGMAVALENSGLIVPVVKNADNLNIIGLARAINDLATRARNKKLKPDDVQDGTFSITNMGSFGSLMGFPIINQPQVAILGVGAIQKRPVVINDAIAIRDMMYISLSFDHRIVDGALGGQFLERIAYYLSNFDTNSVF